MTEETSPRIIKKAKVILMDLAEATDSWRVFPRLFITTYIYLLYKVVMWYIGLDDPSVEQSGMVSIISGVGAAWFNSYVNTRPKARKNDYRMYENLPYPEPRHYPEYRRHPRSRYEEPYDYGRHREPSYEPHRRSPPENLTRSGRNYDDNDSWNSTDY